LVLDVNSSSKDGCDFVGVVLIFPVETLIVPELLDSEKRVEFFDMVVFQIVRVKHIDFDELLYLLVLSLLMQQHKLIPILGGKHCIDPILVEA